jgi:hypothetical protein
MAKSRTLKSLAKSLDFVNEKDAAGYIYVSFQNGNIGDSRKMFQALEADEKARCIGFIQNWYEPDATKLVNTIITWLAAA